MEFQVLFILADAASSPSEVFCGSFSLTSSSWPNVKLKAFTIPVLWKYLLKPASMNFPSLWIWIVFASICSRNYAWNLSLKHLKPREISFAYDKTVEQKMMQTLNENFWCVSEQDTARRAACLLHYPTACTAVQGIPASKESLSEFNSSFWWSKRKCLITVSSWQCSSINAQFIQ